MNEKEWKKDPFHDRQCGTMGVGSDKDAIPDWEGEGGSVPGNASGWESKSYDAGGLPSGSVPSSGQSTDDGPAWPSHSKGRK